MKRNSISINQKKISWHYISYIRYFIVGCFTPIIWGWNLAPKADAAPLYDAFIKGATAQTATILGAFPAGAALTPIFTAIFNVIPWVVLIASGGAICWQAYEGYKEYSRENFSGITAPVLNIIVIFVLLILTDRASGFIFTGA